MFDDIISDKKGSNGCWNCEHCIAAFISLYCKKLKKYKLVNDGQNCEDWQEKC